MLNYHLLILTIIDYVSLIGVTGAVISMYDVGCFLGAIAIGYFADKIGRDRTLSLASVVFIIGAIIQAASYSVTQIVSRVSLVSIYCEFQLIK